MVSLGIFPLPSFVTLTADILIFPAKFCYAYCRYANISHCRCQNGPFGFIFIPLNLHHILQRICYIVFNLFCSPGPVTKDLFPRGLTFSATKDRSTLQQLPVLCVVFYCIDAICDPLTFATGV